MNKKIFSIIVCIVVIASLSLALVGCGVTITDPDKVQDYIKKVVDGNNYTITTTITVDKEVTEIVLKRDDNKMYGNTPDGEGYIIKNGKDSLNYEYNVESKKWTSIPMTELEATASLAASGMVINTMTVAFAPSLFEYDKTTKEFKSKIAPGVTFKIANGNITMSTVIEQSTTVITITKVGSTKVELPKV